MPVIPEHPKETEKHVVVSQSMPIISDDTEKEVVITQPVPIVQEPTKETEKHVSVSQSVPIISEDPEPMSITPEPTPDTEKRLVPILHESPKDVESIMPIVSELLRDEKHVVINQPVAIVPECLRDMEKRVVFTQPMPIDPEANPSDTESTTSARVKITLETVTVATAATQTVAADMLLAKAKVISMFFTNLYTGCFISSLYILHVYYTALQLKHTRIYSGSQKYSDN